jgi:hypothetical protein
VAVALRPAEWTLIGYAGFVIAVALTRGGQPGTTSIALGHALVVVLVLLLARAPATRFTRIARDVAPLALLPVLYAAIDVLNAFGARPAYDSVVQTLELRLFGLEPSRDWWRGAPSAFWSTVTHAAYASYYLIVPFPVAYFLLTRRPALARRAVFGLVLVFVVCYAWFILFPVEGPYYAYDRPDAWFISNPPARLVYATLATGSSWGAAFPSSHVAATWMAVASTWAGSPRAALVLIPPAVLLTIGVVYTQMHYALDAAAGVVLCALAVPLLRRRPSQAGRPSRMAGAPAEAERG